MILALYTTMRALSFAGATPEETLLSRLPEVFRDDMRPHFREQLIDLWDGKLFQLREVLNYALARVRATGTGEAATRRVIGVFANATGVKNLGSEWWLRFAGTLAARFPDDRIVEIVPASGRSLLDNRYRKFRQIGAWREETEPRTR